jgi:hypothetical protein
MSGDYQVVGNRQFFSLFKRQQPLAEINLAPIFKERYDEKRAE